MSSSPGFDTDEFERGVRHVVRLRKFASANNGPSKDEFYQTLLDSYNKSNNKGNNNDNNKLSSPSSSPSSSSVPAPVSSASVPLFVTPHAHTTAAENRQRIRKHFGDDFAEAGRALLFGDRYVDDQLRRNPNLSRSDVPNFADCAVAGGATRATLWARTVNEWRHDKVVQQATEEASALLESESRGDSFVLQHEKGASIGLGAMEAVAAQFRSETVAMRWRERENEVQQRTADAINARLSQRSRGSGALAGGRLQQVIERARQIERERAKSEELSRRRKFSSANSATTTTATTSPGRHGGEEEYDEEEKDVLSLAMSECRQREMHGLWLRNLLPGQSSLLEKTASDVAVDRNQNDDDDDNDNGEAKAFRTQQRQQQQQQQEDERFETISQRSASMRRDDKAGARLEDQQQQQQQQQRQRSSSLVNNKNASPASQLDVRTIRSRAAHLLFKTPDQIMSDDRGAQRQEAPLPAATATMKSSGVRSITLVPSINSDAVAAVRKNSTSGSNSIIANQDDHRVNRALSRTPTVSSVASSQQNQPCSRRDSSASSQPSSSSVADRKKSGNAGAGEEHDPVSYLENPYVRELRQREEERRNPRMTARDAHSQVLLLLTAEMYGGEEQGVSSIDNNNNKSKSNSVPASSSALSSSSSIAGGHVKTVKNANGNNSSFNNQSEELHTLSLHGSKTRAEQQRARDECLTQIMSTVKGSTSAASPSQYPSVLDMSEADATALAGDSRFAHVWNFELLSPAKRRAMEQQEQQQQQQKSQRQNETTANRGGQLINFIAPLSSNQLRIDDENNNNVIDRAARSSSFMMKDDCINVAFPSSSSASSMSASSSSVSRSMIAYKNERLQRIHEQLHLLESGPLAVVRTEKFQCRRVRGMGSAGPAATTAADAAASSMYAASSSSPTLHSHPEGAASVATAAASSASAASPLAASSKQEAAAAAAAISIPTLIPGSGKYSPILDIKLDHLDPATGKPIDLRKTNIPEPDLFAYQRYAREKNTVLIIRPVSDIVPVLYATEGLHIKGKSINVSLKSSSYMPIHGLIPVNPALGKAYVEAVRREREIEEMVLNGTNGVVTISLMRKLKAQKAMAGTMTQAFRRDIDTALLRSTSELQALKTMYREQVAGTLNKAAVSGQFIDQFNSAQFLGMAQARWKGWPIYYREIFVQVERDGKMERDAENTVERVANTPVFYILIEDPEKIRAHEEMIKNKKQQQQQRQLSDSLGGTGNGAGNDDDDDPTKKEEEDADPGWRGKFYRYNPETNSIPIDEEDDANNSNNNNNNAVDDDADDKDSSTLVDEEKENNDGSSISNNSTASADDEPAEAKMKRNGKKNKKKSRAIKNTAGLRKVMIVTHTMFAISETTKRIEQDPTLYMIGPDFDGLCYARRVNPSETARQRIEWSLAANTYSLQRTMGLVNKFDEQHVRDVRILTEWKQNHGYECGNTVKTQAIAPGPHVVITPDSFSVLDNVQQIIAYIHAAWRQCNIPLLLNPNWRVVLDPKTMLPRLYGDFLELPVVDDCGAANTQMRFDIEDPQQKTGGYEKVKYAATSIEVRVAEVQKMEEDAKKNRGKKKAEAGGGGGGGGSSGSGGAGAGTGGGHASTAATTVAREEREVEDLTLVEAVMLVIDKKHLAELFFAARRWMLMPPLFVEQDPHDHASPAGANNGDDNKNVDEDDGDDNTILSSATIDYKSQFGHEIRWNAPFRNPKPHPEYEKFRRQKVDECLAEYRAVREPFLYLHKEKSTIAFVANLDDYLFPTPIVE